MAKAGDIERLAAKLDKWAGQTIPDFDQGPNLDVFVNLLTLISKEVRPLVAALKDAGKAGELRGHILH